VTEGPGRLRYATVRVWPCSVALAVDMSGGATDEVQLLRDELSSRENALTLVNAELERVRRHTEQLNKRYQTALEKYDSQQLVDDQFIVK